MLAHGKTVTMSAKVRYYLAPVPSRLNEHRARRASLEESLPALQAGPADAGVVVAAAAQHWPLGSGNLGRDPLGGRR